MRWMMSCSGSSASVRPIFMNMLFPRKTAALCAAFTSRICSRRMASTLRPLHSPKEEILIEYGQAIAEDPKHVPEELFAKLKANFTEEEIVVITAMGVMMIANNYFNDILDVTPDKLV